MWQSLFSLRGLGPCGSSSRISRALYLLVRVVAGLAFCAASGSALAVDWFYAGNTAKTGFLVKGKTGKEVCDVVVPSIEPGWVARSTGYWTNQGDECPAQQAANPNMTARIGYYYYKYCPAENPELVWQGAGPVCAVAPPPPPPSCKAGVAGTGSWPAGKTGGGYPKGSVIETGGCVAGCKVEVQDVKSCWSSGGNDTCVWTTATTGDSCSAGDGTAAPSAAPPADAKREDVPPITKSKCPGGTVQGGIDDHGTPICIGTGTDPTNAPPPPPKSEVTKSETLPDGSTKTTTTTTTTNSDGSKTTEIKTVITAPTGERSETISKDVSPNMSGGAGRDDSTREDDKFDLCKQNPMLTICRNSSVSGSCGQISCEGDAIQCATLRAAAAMQCKQQADEEGLKASPLAAKGQAAIDGTDLQGLPSPGNGQIVNIGAAMQGSQGWLGSGSAFDDVTFTVQGHQVVVPLSKWSGYLESLRYVMMIIASLISFRILGTAILKE